MINKIKIQEEFQLESGEFLPEIEITYNTYGEYNSERNNVIWICHALTANADAEDWWNGIVGEGKLYDPSKNFIICANILGSHYGTTCPLSVNPQTGKKYYRTFPNITVRDMVNTHTLLRKELGINKIHTVIGGSIGSYQAIEWAIIEPDIFTNLIIVAGSAKTTPWLVAFNEAQRMAITADQSYFNDIDEGGIAGMKAARAIALLSYRNDFTYNKMQPIANDDDYLNLKASSYQQYQGEKLANRFNAYSYYSLSRSVDSHNVGRGRKSIENALSKIKAKTLVLGIDTDTLFDYKQQKQMHDNIKNSKLVIINSNFGHDGFLIESEKITEVVNLMG